MGNFALGSLFAGIGGIDLGFCQSGVKTLWANEIDPSCAKTFALNFDTDLIVGDISSLKGLPSVDILAGGFPCQPFSIAGYRKGFEDDRGNLFFQIARLISEFRDEGREPKAVFLENVKNLRTHGSGETFGAIRRELERLGYYVAERILNTASYGNLPQNRERLYIVAFLDENQKKRFKWPNEVELTNTIDKVIDRNERVDGKYYYDSSMKCYPLLRKSIINGDSIYQYRRVYVRENKTGLCPTLTANMGTGGHNVPLILTGDGRIRKLTPRECLSLQGFPRDFAIPSDLPDSKIYKQAGNAVSVEVVRRIAEKIVEALE